MHTQPIQVGISIGELMDKITILEIKALRIADPHKLRNVQRELDELEAVGASLALGQIVRAHVQDLRDVNLLLWDVEDALRDCEHAGDFGNRFVELARSVYKHNDRRAAIKKEINEVMGSHLFEEKSYSEKPSI